MTKHSSTKSIEAGMIVLVAIKGQMVGGGEVVAVNGRTITLAEVTETYSTSDCGTPAHESTELALVDYTLGRSVIAWEK